MVHSDRCWLQLQWEIRTSGSWTLSLGQNRHTSPRHRPPTARCRYSSPGLRIALTLTPHGCRYSGPGFAAGMTPGTVPRKGSLATPYAPMLAPTSSGHFESLGVALQARLQGGALGSLAAGLKDNVGEYLASGLGSGLLSSFASSVGRK